MHLIWGGVAFVAVTMGAFVTLLALHVDPSPLTAVIAAVVTPIITAVYIVSQLGDIRRRVESVDTKVNGHMSALTTKIPDANPASDHDGGES